MYRVLIVDDEPMALFSAAHAFPWARFGFNTPVTTTDPQTALELLRTQTFDAAFVDIRMPGLTGMELISICNEESIRTVFIVLTGYTDFHYAQTALRLRAFDYCLKPILPEMAEATLARLSTHIYGLRCQSDPETIASIVNTATLHKLFALHGLPEPEGNVSLILAASATPLKLPTQLSDILDNTPMLWADKHAVLILTMMDEISLQQKLGLLQGIRCCYAPGVTQDSSPLSRQYKLMLKIMTTLSMEDSPMRLRLNDCSPAFLELLNYVDEHLIEDLSLQQLANRFHLNYTYCSELFRSVTGLTFTKYLTKHRMERAADLIIHSNISMAEIAHQTGYSNYNHFSATFKTHFGQTPGQFRSLHQEEGDA